MDSNNGLFLALNLRQYYQHNTIRIGIANI